tara:strand:- start:63 stop:266 length:204 start_codon:yes stop_codon:yes gene_type:complete
MYVKQEIVMLQLLAPRKDKDGYYEVLKSEDTENNRKVMIEQAKKVEGCVVLATLNHCTVRVIYGEKN